MQKYLQEVPLQHVQLLSPLYYARSDITIYTSERLFLFAVEQKAPYKVTQGLLAYPGAVPMAGRLLSSWRWVWPDKIKYSRGMKNNNDASLKRDPLTYYPLSFYKNGDERSCYTLSRLPSGGLNSLE